MRFNFQNDGRVFSTVTLCEARKSMQIAMISREGMKKVNKNVSRFAHWDDM